MKTFSAGGPVKIRQGKYAGNSFVASSTEGGLRVFIAKGRLYTRDKPEKKNVRHLQKTQINLKCCRMFDWDRPMNNIRLAQKISSVSDNGSISCRQGG